MVGLAVVLQKNDYYLKLELCSPGHVGGVEVDTPQSLALRE